MVCTSTVIVIFNPSILCLIAANSTGKGWQSGITSLVFLIASRPAALENSKTSPLGTILFFIASIVSGLETDRIAEEIGWLKLFDLCVISIIIIYSLSIDRSHRQIILCPRSVILLLFFPLFHRML